MLLYGYTAIGLMSVTTFQVSHKLVSYVLVFLDDVYRTQAVACSYAMHMQWNYAVGA